MNEIAARGPLVHMEPKLSVRPYVKGKDDVASYLIEIGAAGRTLQQIGQINGSFVTRLMFKQRLMEKQRGRRDDIARLSMNRPVTRDYLEILSLYNGRRLMQTSHRGIGIVSVVRRAGLVDKTLGEIKLANTRVYNRVRILFYKARSTGNDPGLNQKLFLQTKIDETLLTALERQTTTGLVAPVPRRAPGTIEHEHLKRAVTAMHAAKPPEDTVRFRSLEKDDPLAAKALAGWAENLHLPPHRSLGTDSLLDRQTARYLVLRSNALERLSRTQTYAERESTAETQRQYLARILGQSTLRADDEAQVPARQIEWPLKRFVELHVLLARDIDRHNQGDPRWVPLAEPRAVTPTPAPATRRAYAEISRVSRPPGFTTGQGL